MTDLRPKGAGSRARPFETLPRRVRDVRRVYRYDDFGLLAGGTIPLAR
jgi:hypothetical protein